MLPKTDVRGEGLELGTRTNLDVGVPCLARQQTGVEKTKRRVDGDHHHG